jgi:hypothetical protein
MSVSSSADIKSRRPRVARCALALLGAVLVVLPGNAMAAVPVAAPARVLDGPSSAIAGLSGLSVARDGTGGLVYLKQVAGVEHVFVSALVRGVFQAPVVLDGGLGGTSSQPVIAAGNGGMLLAAFINSGALYVVTRASGAEPYGAPAALLGGASNPALALSNSGKGYLAFAAPGAGGHDVRTAYYYQGRWALESAPLDAVPADDAGAGVGSVQVAVAGDGVAIVAWGEAGHIYSRRIWGTAPSVVYEPADVPSLAGLREVSADQPRVGVGGDSSYADVAFREVLSSGFVQSSRVLERRLRGSKFDSLAAADGLSTPGAGGASAPAVAIDEYGQGLVTSTRLGSNQLFAMTLANNGAAQGVQRVDSAVNLAPPYAVPTRAGYHDGLIAWQQRPGSTGVPEIRARFYNGSGFEPEIVLSSPALGPAAAASGLAAAGDITADVAVAWVQGTGSRTQIVATQLYQPPGAFGPRRALSYARTHHPRLTWSPPRAPWGPLSYAVSLDGILVGQTGANALVAPVPLADGPHALQVTAVNPAGLQSNSRPATVWVDTVAPRLRLTLAGRRRARGRLRVHAAYTDAPPGEPPSAASGIARVVVRWGDGTSSQIGPGGHGAAHAYPRAGHYRLTVFATDRAGNTTRVVRRLVIAPAAGR